MDGSSREDPPADGDTPGEDTPWPVRHADALVELARTGLGTRRAAGADRYMVHVVVRHDHSCHLGAEILGGDPLDPAALAEIVCDCSTVTHHTTPAGAPLALGRRTRTWSAAQRRAITVRDGGHCRWPGCRRTHVDIHHHRPWETGGPTDTTNALTLCPAHHTRIHAGYHTTGHPHGPLTFHRPDGTPLGTTTPAGGRPTIGG